MFVPPRAASFVRAGFAQVGRIQIGTCGIRGSAVDPALHMLVLVRVVIGEACQREAGTDAYFLDAYSTLTGRRIARAPFTFTGSGTVMTGEPGIDPIRHRLFVALGTTQAGSPDRVLEFSLHTLVSGVRSIAATGETLVPNNVVQLAASGASVSPTPTENATGASGDVSLLPTGIRYDPTDDAVYLVLVENFGGTTSLTSAHGPGSQDVYLLRVDPAAHHVTWAYLLGQCVFSLSVTTLYYLTPLSDPILVHHGPKGTTVSAGCLASRAPGIVPAPQLVTGGGNGDGVTLLEGSGLVYTLPLDAQGHPVAASVAYRQGRPHTRGALVDQATGRMFLVNTPGDTRAGSSGSGPSAVAYDAATRYYVGAPTIGSHDATNGGFAVAAGNGRFYAVGKNGVTVFDDGLTPPGQGSVFPGYRCTAYSSTLDTGTGRLFVQPRDHCRVSDPASPYLDVIEDRVPHAIPVPEVDPDSFTQQVDENVKDTVVDFNGHASATAGRVRLVGGVTGFLNGSTFNGYTIVTKAVGSQDSPDFANHEVSIATIPGADLGQYQSAGHADVQRADNDTQQMATQQTGKKWPYEQAFCSDPGTRSDRTAYGADSTSSVECRFGSSVTAIASAGSMGLYALLGVPNGLDLPAAVAIGGGSVHATVQKDSKSGIVSNAMSSARGLEIGPVRVAGITVTTTCVAHGRRGTAHCEYHRRIVGVSVTGAPGVPPGCDESYTNEGYTGATTCASLIQALNAIQPGQLVFSAPVPDKRRGGRTGSPGGYQAVVERERFRHLEDTVLNYDESVEVPGLAVLVLNDSPTQPSRLDLQFASVEAEARYGIHRLSQDCTGPCVTPPSAPPTAQPTPAGPVLRPSPAPRMKHVAGPDSDDRDPIDGIVGTIGHLIKRFFDGVRWLLRSPTQAVLVGLVLTLLCQPFFLSRRRRRLELLLEGTA
jgi:hypothetical protein